MNLIRVWKDLLDSIVRLTGLIHRAADAVEAQLPGLSEDTIEHQHNGEPERRLPAGKRK